MAYREMGHFDTANFSSMRRADHLAGGADRHEGDRLGKMKLSTQGLAARDEMGFSRAGQQRIPVAVTMAGGYGTDLVRTVDVHIQTIRLASRHATAWRHGDG